MKRILIIDDDVDMCLLLKRFLTRNGFEVEVAHSAAKGLSMVKEGRYDVVFTDFRLGDKDGKEVVKEIKEYDSSIIVIMITGYSDVKVAVDVIKQGAYDYITKPLVPEEVLSVINEALGGGKSAAETKNAKKATVTKEAKGKEKTYPKEFLVGEAPTTKDLYTQIEIVAPSSYSIILYGESGTGKEVIAKTIHSLSPRKDKPFIAMDCGTLSKELSGSELFGHVKGAFTGALTDKEGHFELANGGTLFLDEVANLSPEVQASLLRVIQERKFKRVGGNKELPVDVRIIVASNENLQEAYRKGKFREDLYHRFNEFSINLPPLRMRKTDIPLFADFFLTKTNEELGRNVFGFEDEVMEMFVNYNWPGNLREFRNVVRRSVLLTPTGYVNKSTLPWEITGGFVTKDGEDKKEEIAEAPYDLKDAASRAEYNAIMKVLKEVNFNKTKAAEILKIDRKTLYNKIKFFEEIGN